MRRISGHLIAVAALVLSCVSNLSGQRVAVAALAQQANGDTLVPSQPADLRSSAFGTDRRLAELTQPQPQHPHDCVGVMVSHALVFGALGAWLGYEFGKFPDGGTPDGQLKTAVVGAVAFAASAFIHTRCPN